MDAALDAADPALVAAINAAAKRIKAFHAADMPRNNAVETAPGLICEVRYQALSPVGLYVPGGSAPLVSTVLMLAIPAVLAGCEEIVMCSPPNRDGRISSEILVAARLCGVTRMFCAGGAQAVAAMAYGTATIPRCAKIFGPGNVTTTDPCIEADKKEIVTKNYPCSPCRHRFFQECDPSPHNKPYCIEDITVDDVMMAVERLNQRVG